MPPVKRPPSGPASANRGGKPRGRKPAPRGAKPRSAGQKASAGSRTEAWAHARMRDARYRSRQLAAAALGAIVVLSAVVVTAAWLGGSMPVWGQRFHNGVDVTMRAVGLSVDAVYVKGVEDPRDIELIRQQAMIEPGENMFRADPRAIRARVEALDRVESALVVRFWPNQIRIEVEPRIPLALWQKQGVWSVLDQKGLAFAQEPVAAHRDLFRVIGPGADLAAPSLLSALSARPELFERADLAFRVGERRWDIKLKSGVEIALPADAELCLGLDQLMRLHARSSVLDLAVERIDLRDPERIAIRPKSAVRKSAARKPAATGSTSKPAPKEV